MPLDSVSTIVPEHLAGKRLDQALAEMFPQYSRSRLKDWILARRICVDGRFPKPRDRVTGGERVDVDPEPDIPETLDAQEIKIDVVYEDDDIIVVNKHAGLVVHPGAGNPDGTLANALLNHAPETRTVPRAGIVHRLDKNTTGLLVTARTLAAHTALVRMIEARELDRHYLAVCVGQMVAGGTVDAPIGRHPVDRKRMTVRSDGREAVTHYRVREKYPAHTLVDVKLDTGRTHQIRVHMAHIRFSILGDPVYGGRLAIPAGASDMLAETLRSFRRQALHAASLGFVHPITKAPLDFEAPLPADMKALVDELRRESRDDQ